MSENKRQQEKVNRNLSRISNPFLKLTNMSADIIHIWPRDISKFLTVREIFATILFREICGLSILGSNPIRYPSLVDFERECLKKSAYNTRSAKKILNSAFEASQKKLIRTCIKYENK